MPIAESRFSTENAGVGAGSISHIPLPRDISQGAGYVLISISLRFRNYSGQPILLEMSFP
jgi:hypothetical protein